MSRLYRSRPAWRRQGTPACCTLTPCSPTLTKYYVVIGNKQGSSSVKKEETSRRLMFDLWERDKSSDKTKVLTYLVTNFSKIKNMIEICVTKYLLNER